APSPPSFVLTPRPPPHSPPFPYTTLFRSGGGGALRRLQPGHHPRRPRQAHPRRRLRHAVVGALHGSQGRAPDARGRRAPRRPARSEEHTSELQSLTNLVCRLLLEKKKHTP